MSNNALNTVRQYIHRLSPDDIPDGHGSEFLSVPEGRIFATVEKCSYVSFLVYIASLAAYGIYNVW